MDMSNAVWRKSSYSSANGCVEVAFVDDQALIRDTKDRSGPVLAFSRHEWEAFLAAVRAGEYQLPHLRR
jgi:Domain of unknown function (DUF397)